MNVLVISHTYIAPMNREKWRVFAHQHPDVVLTIVYPHAWHGQLLAHQEQTSYQEGSCRFVPIKAYGVGNEMVYWYAPLALLRLIRQAKPDIVYVEQGDAALCYLQTILSCKLLRLRPLFLFFTWINWHPVRSRKYRLIWRWIERFNLVCSHGAVVGNPTAGVILRHKGFLKPINVIPQLGVDTAHFVPAVSTDSATKWLSFFGRLVPEKGVICLLEVFASLAPHFPAWSLRFVGKGPCLQQLRAMVDQYDLQDRVQIMTSVPHEQIPQLMQKTDILVLPSIDTPTWKEQFGHVLIEAMACQVAVVASDAGDIPSVVQDAGFLYKQGDADALRQTLQSVMNDASLRAVVAQRGYHRAHQWYSHQQVAQALHTFWQELHQKN